MRKKRIERDSRDWSLGEQYWLGPLCLLIWVVGILLMIHGCSFGAECKLAWDAAPASEQVTSYKVYVGIDCVATTNTNSATVNLPDQPCTVGVVACNASGQSTPALINLSYIVDQETVDLKAWSTMRGYYAEFLPGKRFYRTKIQTP